MVALVLCSWKKSSGWAWRVLRVLTSQSSMPRAFSKMCPSSVPLQTQALPQRSASRSANMWCCWDTIMSAICQGSAGTLHRIECRGRQ